jgi:hypothetical protein
LAAAKREKEEADKKAKRYLFNAMIAEENVKKAEQELVVAEGQAKIAERQAKIEPLHADLALLQV